MKKIIFLTQLSPPVHGASVINSSIKNSKKINECFDTYFLNISPSSGVDDLEKFGIGKLYKSLIEALILSIKIRPDVLYITLSPHGLAFWKDACLLKICGFFSCKVVVHLHGKGVSDEVNSSAFKMFLYKSIFKSTNVIHLSKSLYSDIEDVFDSKRNIYYLNNGVKGSPYLRNQNFEKIKIIYLSNLIPSKGVDTLIESLNKLSEKDAKKIIVNVVGGISDESFLAEMKNKVSHKLKDIVKFLGPIYGDDKYKMLAGSDVFVLPTRFKNECFPLSILEAFSAGLPVFSTFEGAIPDIITNGENGYLFDKLDSSKLSELISKYINDPELINIHGKRALADYKNLYTLQEFENKFVDILTSIIDDKG